MNPIEQLKLLMKHRPSAIRNNFVVFLIRWLSLWASFAFIAFGVFAVFGYADDFLKGSSEQKIFTDNEFVLAAFCWGTAILLFLIRYLGRQLIERNQFILHLEEMVEELPDVESTTVI